MAQISQSIMSLPARAGLIAGLAVLVLVLILPAPAGLSVAGWRVAALAICMAIWWSTEPLPVGITALLPLVALPLMGASSMEEAAAPYANPLIFLFLGGFLLAAAVQRWGLHRRLAWLVLRAFGSAPARLVAGVMLAVGFLSMWISNTAAVMLMLPVALSVIAATEAGPGHSDHGAQRRFALALLLGLAFAANIGGVGTLIGTPPNALLAAWLESAHGVRVSFASWLAVGLPLVALMLPLCWLVLTRLVFPLPARLPGIEGEQALQGLAPGGAMSPAERRVALVMLAAALGWVTRPLLNRLPGLEGLTDPIVALLCAMALFVIPTGNPGKRRFLLVWTEARRIAWQVLLLFGGGLSLAAAMTQTGLADWIAEGLAGVAALPSWAFLLVLAAAVGLLTSMVSNTAVVAALLPVMGALAVASGLDVVVLGVVVTMAASCAFLLPAATPPNAVVFASSQVRVADMLRAGVVVNLIAVGVVALCAWLLAPLLR